MKYTLHQLEIFKKVVEVESVTKASEELYLTQPAISIQLKKLQEQFAQPLFEVIGRQLYITDFGKDVAKTVDKILEEVATLNSKTHTFSGQLAGKLKIALVSTGKYVMPYFLTDFLNSNLGVQLSMDVTNKSKVVESLENNSVDFGLVSVIPQHMKINSIKLLPNEIYLVGGRSHDVSSDKKIPSGELSSLPMIYREYGSATRYAMENFFKERGVQHIKRLELTSNEALKQAIIAGLGYSMMPLIGIKNELMAGDIKILDTAGLPIITNWHLIWLKSKRLSPTALAYVEYLNENSGKIATTSFEWFEKYKM